MSTAAVPPLSRPLPALVVGERLRLERWRRDAVDQVTRLIEGSSASLSAFLPWAVTTPSREQEAAIQRAASLAWASGRQIDWMVVEDGAIRGMIGLHRRGGPDELEVGYWLDAAAQGRGLMTAACTMAVDVAFATDEVDAIEIVHDVANVRSAAIPARLGFSRYGSFSDLPVARSETGVKVRWVVRRREWARGHPRSSVRHAE